MRQSTQLPATISPPSRKYGGDLSGVDPVEQDHDKEHDDRVEEIEVCLVSQKITVEALKVLGGAEDRADHDQETSQVQRHHMFPPGNTAVGEASG